jgi:hypothetical protein
MRESTLLNMVCTLVEVAGLIHVVIVGSAFLGQRHYSKFRQRPDW